VSQLVFGVILYYVCWNSLPDLQWKSYNIWHWTVCRPALVILSCSFSSRRSPILRYCWIVQTGIPWQPSWTRVMARLTHAFSQFRLFWKYLLVYWIQESAMLTKGFRDFSPGWGCILRSFISYISCIASVDCIFTKYGCVNGSGRGLL
jgi:hypothetical protein